MCAIPYNNDVAASVVNTLIGNDDPLKEVRKNPKVKKVKEIDMTTVDVTTGEIKEKLEPVRIVWSGIKLRNHPFIETWISGDGKEFEVQRRLGNNMKYTLTDSLENARRIISSKDPLLVMLSVK